MCPRYTFCKFHLTLLLERGTAKDALYYTCLASQHKSCLIPLFFVCVGGSSISDFQCVFVSCCWLWLFRLELCFFFTRMSEMFLLNFLIPSDQSSCQALKPECCHLLRGGWSFPPLQTLFIGLPACHMLSLRIEPFEQLDSGEPS